MRTHCTDPRQQRGAVAIITALTLIVLLGFAGLAIDGGHLYVTKTELQNSADACALAASYELTGSPIPAENFTRAENAGKTVGARNNVDFQGSAIAANDIDVTFAAALNDSWVSASSATGTSKYVRCTIVRDGIVPWLMQLLGAGEQTVSALATATLSPSQNNCAIPMALCTDPANSAPNFGYIPGNWYSMNFDESGGGSVDQTTLTGNFRWIDFDPSNSTPGCTGGGASELACLFKGAGQCSLPPIGPNLCTITSPAQPGCVGQTGSAQSLGKAFNSRFGICQGGSTCSNDELRSTPPDFTGFAYTAASWALGRDAYSGSSGGTPNLRGARAAHLPVQSSEKPPGSGSATTGQLTIYGADRRLVTVPFVDCDDFASGATQYAPIRGYACVLLLHPYDKVSGHVKVTAEYLGASNEPGSPCATSGAVGSASSVGPLVPALVQ